MKKFLLELIIWVISMGIYAVPNSEALFYATRKGEIEKIKSLLKSGIDVNVKDSEGKTPLFYAESIKTAQVLIKNGADINIKDNNKKSVLYYALKNKQIELANWLFNKGAKWDKKWTKDLLKKENNSYYYSPSDILHGLIIHGYLKLLKTINAKSFIAKNINKYCFLHLAVASNNIEMVKYMLDFDPDINSTDCGLLLIEEEMPKINYYNILATFIEFHRNIAPLHIALLVKDINILKLLLKNGANPNVKISFTYHIGKDYYSTFSYEFYPIQLATYLGNITAVKMLIKNRGKFYGGNIINSVPVVKDSLMEKIKNNEDLEFGYEKDIELFTVQTPLDIAAIMGYTNLVKLFLKHQRKKSKFALHWACVNGNITIVKMLIKHGYNVNEKILFNDISNITPLHIAAKYKRLKIAKILIRYGARVNAKDGEGKTPLNYAKSVKMIKLLKAYGAHY